MKRTNFTLAFLLGLSACSGADTSKELGAGTVPPSCRKVGAGNPVLVFMTDRRTADFDAAIGRLTDPNTKAFRDCRLGLADTPTVILATYDVQGHISERGSFNLHGTGKSRGRREKNATEEIDRLKAASAAIPADGNGNALFALHEGAQLATSRGGKAAAVVTFGLGRSMFPDGRRLEAVDIDSPAARKAVIDELLRKGLLTQPTPAAVSIVRPAEGVSNPVAVGYLREFVTTELCRTVSTTMCQALEGLP